MPEPPTPRLRWFRLLERLGFRWVFPIGTLAVPVHPVLVRVLPWVPVAAVTYAVSRIVGGLEGGISWWALLVAAAVLGLVLSVPVLCYALFAFRIPLTQSACIAGAMVLLAVDVAAGREPWAWGALPAAYAGVYLLQWIGGHLALRGMRRSHDAAMPVPATDGVALSGPDRTRTAAWLVEHADAPEVGFDEVTWLRLRPDERARAQALTGQVDVDWYRWEGEYFVVPGRRPAGVTVEESRYGSRLHLVTGDGLMQWEVRSGGATQRLFSGMAGVVGPVPLVVCFYFVAVFGGRSQWVTGFVRRRAAAFGAVDDVLGRVFEKRPDVPTYADATDELERLEALVAERRERYLAVLDRLADKPVKGWRANHLADLHVVRGQAMAGTGDRLCDLIDRAKEERGWELAGAAAIALAGIPADELRALTPRILRITGSRILSLEWRVTPDLDVTPLPRNLPRFGNRAGFGLLGRAPRLYERLGELDDPRVLRVLEGLAEEAGWTRPLQRARDAYLARRSPS
jgi:hypothetical protein